MISSILSRLVIYDLYGQRTIMLKPSLNNVFLVMLTLIVLGHQVLTYFLFYPAFRLLFGTLYPAYASYKAVKTKNVKEYVKWMMYWIVFALFTCVETFTDVFLSWLPFYYEIKIILVIWLLSPATKGSSILYRKFVHPTLSSREQEIDEYISRAKEQSYRQFLDLGSKGMTALMQTALKGGGGIVNQLRKSYSLSELRERDGGGRDEGDGVVVTDPRLLRRRRSPPDRSIASTSAVYFSEVDVRSDRITHVQSVEDISSGYSSSEGLFPGQPPKLQVREGLTRTGSLSRTRPTRVTRSGAVPKRTPVSEESDESDTNVVISHNNAQNISEAAELSDDEFLDCLDAIESKLVQIDNVPSTVVTADPADLHGKTQIVDCKASDEHRAGRYRKRVAPKPPPQPPLALDETKTAAIKATLILKPGVVRPLDTSGAERKEVFVQSPKLRRRRSQSPSSLLKLIKLPKIGLWNKDGNKRTSWHDFPNNNPSKLSKVQSKSHNDLSATMPQTPCKAVCRFSIQNLTESPMAHRRLKIIKRYIDEDID